MYKRSRCQHVGIQSGTAALAGRIQVARSAISSTCNPAQLSVLPLLHPLLLARALSGKSWHSGLLTLLCTVCHEAHSLAAASSIAAFECIAAQLEVGFMSSHCRCVPLSLKSLHCCSVPLNHCGDLLSAFAAGPEPDTPGQEHHRLQWPGLPQRHRCVSSKV